MLKKTMIVACLALSATLVQAQDKYFTKTGKIAFYSKAPMEDIEAKNKTVVSILDTKTGALQFAVLMKSFEFEKALMQEHFNENYVESGKYPKAEFRGVVENNASINYARPGAYPVTVIGKLTLHGVTRDVEAAGTLNVADSRINANSVFNISLSDHNISIPAVVKEKISNNIRIAVDCNLEPLK